MFPFEPLRTTFLVVLTRPTACVSAGEPDVPVPKHSQASIEGKTHRRDEGFVMDPRRKPDAEPERGSPTAFESDREVLALRPR